MPGDNIMSQLVEMLTSENNNLQSSGASTLSAFAQYGEDVLSWKPFSMMIAIQRTCEH